MTFNDQVWVYQDTRVTGQAIHLLRVNAHEPALLCPGRHKIDASILVASPESDIEAKVIIPFPKDTVRQRLLTKENHRELLLRQGTVPRTLFTMC